MNERIKQLAEQARAEVRADWAKGNKIPYPEAHYAFQRDNDQKFAELIVAECVKLQYKNVVVGGVSDYNRGRRELTEDIQKHFGVEE
jgi:hypothetical protein